MSAAADVDRSRAVPLFMSEVEAMGGAERSVLALGRWLHRHGHRPYLLTFRDHVGLEEHADYPLPKVEIAPDGGARTKLAALRRHLRTSPPSEAPMITSGYQPALYASLALAGRFHCLMHDTPSLFRPAEERTFPDRLRLAVSNRLIGWGMRRGRGRMIVTSEYLQRECHEDFGVQAAIARMGGLGGAHTFRRRPVQGRLQMLSVSRIEANKRIDWILHALAELERSPVPLSSRVEWSLTLAGKGSHIEALRQLCADLQLQRRITFRGFVPDTELERLYGEAHLFLMPAIQGYGIPAIEALQRGIPVLLSRDSGVSDVLLHTLWAAVIRKREEMEAALRTMLDWLLSNGQLMADPPADLPTEDSWAERVARLCGYV